MMFSLFSGRSEVVANSSVVEVDKNISSNNAVIKCIDFIDELSDLHEITRVHEIMKELDSLKAQINDSRVKELVGETKQYSISVAASLNKALPYIDTTDYEHILKISGPDIKAKLENLQDMLQQEEHNLSGDCKMI
jgi:hypothetical protein